MISASTVDGDDGSSIVEMVVAATLTLLALALLSWQVLPALRMLESAPDPHERQLELLAAGDLLARAVRSARPEEQRAAVGGHEGTLVLAMDPDATVRFILVDGTLSVEVEGSPAGMDGLTSRTLVTGLDGDRSAFSLLDPDGQPKGPSAPVVAVAVTLADEEFTVHRVVRPRMASLLDGPTPW